MLSCSLAQHLMEKQCFYLKQYRHLRAGPGQVALLTQSSMVMRRGASESPDSTVALSSVIALPLVLSAQQHYFAYLHLSSEQHCRVWMQMTPFHVS